MVKSTSNPTDCTSSPRDIDKNTRSQGDHGAQGTVTALVFCCLCLQNIELIGNNKPGGLGVLSSIVANVQHTSDEITLLRENPDDDDGVGGDVDTKNKKDIGSSDEINTKMHVQVREYVFANVLKWMQAKVRPLHEKINNSFSFILSLKFNGCSMHTQ